MIDLINEWMRGWINSYYYGIFILMGINIILAMSLNLVTGFTGQLHLGHAGFMAIGAYTAALLSVKAGVAFTPALLAAGLVAAIFGVLVGLPTLRLRGDYLAIATLGFGEIVRISILNMDITGGPFGLRGIPRLTNLPIVIIVVALSYAVLHSLVHSRIGRAFIAIREDEVAAEVMGIETTRMKVTAFALAAFFAGIAGGLFAFWYRFISPGSFGFMLSIEVLSMVVLGGLGNLLGSVLGAGFITYLPELLRTSAPAIAQHRLVFYGALLVIAMILRPNGLLGTSSEQGWLELWLARRRAKPGSPAAAVATPGDADQGIGGDADGSA